MADYASTTTNTVVNAPSIVTDTKSNRLMPPPLKLSELTGEEPLIPEKAHPPRQKSQSKVSLPVHRNMTSLGFS